MPTSPPIHEDRLRPYLFHGIGLTSRGSQATGDCPSCGRVDKFSVEVCTGLYRCLVCGAAGNGLVFTRTVYEQAFTGIQDVSSVQEASSIRPYTSVHGASSVRNGSGVQGTTSGNPYTSVHRTSSVQNASTTHAAPGTPPNGVGGTYPGRGIPEAADAILDVPGAWLAAVARDRRLADPGTVSAWGVRRAADGAWLVPGYGPDGRLDQVYRRVQMRAADGAWSWRLLPTPGIWPLGAAHALHLPVGDYDPARPNVVVCEGPWDGMALWEVWDQTRELMYFPRADSTNIIAVPGCGVWRDEWTKLCRGKCVTLLYDSDHPRSQPGGRVSRAGYDGMRRVARQLSGIAASVRIIKWGPDGWDVSKPSGWDVRDALTTAEGIDRRHLLADLLAKVEDPPSDWFCASSPLADGQPRHAGSVESMACSTWAACEAAWADAMQWRRDMGDALAVLLAVCASTQQGGSQLFLQLVGSAGSGKTTMCDGLLVSGHCHHLEHLTGFHSGWKLPEDGQKDCSLIARVNGKTLVTPEADVMMSSPRFTEIMGQQRRIFDGKSGATYKNSDKDTLYSGLRTPWIMAGTPALMDHDQSHLGDRFLRFIITDPPEDEKRLILRKAIQSERVAILGRANGTAGSVVDPKTRLAHALTGGYVDWLRANVEEKLSTITVSPEAEDYCIDLAELSADLRARPNEDKRKTEVHDTKEMPTRLARQNIRLASCLAVVLNRTIVDSDVLRIVRKVALDTASGHSQNIVQWLCSPNPKSNYRLYQETGGLAQRTLEIWCVMSSERVLKYLSFLEKICVLDRRRINSLETWVLTQRVYELYLRVMRG